jgi:hypothetical protein
MCVAATPEQRMLPTPRRKLFSSIFEQSVDAVTARDRQTTMAAWCSNSRVKVSIKT